MNAFFAKERTIACRDWFTTNKELIKKGYQMPTPRETWDLIFYLKDNLDKPECQKVYDEILDTDGKTQVGEWQNFLVVENNAGIDSYKNSYCKRALGLDSKNNLIFSQKEAFANHVNSKGFVDIGFINPQGLPSLIDSNKKYIKGKNIYFNNSYMDDTSLVFVKHFNEVDLFFGNTSGIIGVRPIYKIPSEEDYQKQNKDFKQAISEIKKIVNKTDEVLSRLKKK